MKRTKMKALVISFLMALISDFLVIIFGPHTITLNVFEQFSTFEHAYECENLGLMNASLKCSSCNLLPKFDLKFLEKDCLQCCQKDEIESVVKRYAKARLEICTCKFGVYPQIQAFIKSDFPAQFPNLQIRYVHGRDPIIKLIDDSGEVKEVVAIEKWDTDFVDEFLRTHLERENTDYLSSNLI